MSDAQWKQTEFKPHAELLKALKEIRDAFMKTRKELEDATSLKEKSHGTVADPKS